MADKELNMETALHTSDQGKSREHEPRCARRLEKSRDHKSVQTEKVSVRHTGVQFESPTHRNMDITDRQLSAPPSAGNCTNSQLSVPTFETVSNRADTQTEANWAYTQVVVPTSHTVANPADTHISVLPSQTVSNCADTQMVLPPSQTVANPVDTQMTAASSVNVESSSGTQIGGGNSIVHNHNNQNNSTYNITNKTFNIFANVTQFSPSQLTELIRSVEQAADSGDQSSASHPGDDTNQAPNSHSIRKIKTVTSRTVTPNESQVPDNQVQTVTSQSNHPCSSDSDVQPWETAGMQSTLQEQTTSSEQRCQTKRKNPDSHSLNADPLSDVTNTSAYRTAQGNVTDVNGQQTTCNNWKKDSQQTQRGRRSAKTTPCTSIQDSVRIIDSEGQTLVPGDCVWIDNMLGPRAIYIGHKQVVLCSGQDGLVEKIELNLTQPFRKLTVESGECRVFPPMKRVQRAVSRVGTRSTGVDGKRWSYRFDFTCWVTTGLGYSKAATRGFRLR